MDRSFVERQKQLLLEQKRGVAAQLERMTHEKGFDKDKVQTKWEDWGDKEEDNANEVADFQDNISLERNLEIALEKVDGALARIAQGSYGTCEKCGQQIEEARLAAYPEATRCMTDSAKPIE